MLQDQFGIILATPFIIGIFRRFHVRGNPAQDPASNVDTLGNTDNDVLFNRADGADGDTSWQIDLRFPSIDFVFFQLVVKGLTINIQVPGSLADVPVVFFHYFFYV